MCMTSQQLLAASSRLIMNVCQKALEGSGNQDIDSGFPNGGAILQSDIEGQIIPIPKRKKLKL